VAPDDIWAVGSGGGQHWNGSAWTFDPDVDFGVVDAVSSTDVWALGSRYVGGRNRDVFGHWNGSSWTTTKPFKLAGAQGLAAVGSDDVWAVGAAKSRPGVKTFSEHWDGAGWSLVDAPSAGRWAVYHALAAKASNDLWAVGALNQIGIGMHWDGSAWTAERLPHSPQREVLYGVASVPDGGWLAVGWQGSYPVVMQHC
jgi:hypothetical protein